MPVVYEDLELPGGEPAFNALVSYTLVGPGAIPVRLAFNSAQQTIVGSRHIRANSAGRTTADLETNSEITTPDSADTAWRRELVSLEGTECGCDLVTESVAYLTVPAGAGPFVLADIATPEP